MIEHPKACGGGGEVGENGAETHSVGRKRECSRRRIGEIVVNA